MAVTRPAVAVVAVVVVVGVARYQQGVRASGSRGPGCRRGRGLLLELVVVAVGLEVQVPAGELVGGTVLVRRVFVEVAVVRRSAELLWWRGGGRETSE